MTDDPDVRMAASMMDYIFRRLALDFLPYDTRAELGIFTAKERAAQSRPRRRPRRPGRPGRHGRVGAGLRPGRRAEAEPAEGGGRGRGRSRAARRLLDRAAGGVSAGRGRAALLHLRHEDAPGRQLLRLRGLRLDLRLQLTPGSITYHGCLPPESGWNIRDGLSGYRGGGRGSIRLAVLLELLGEHLAFTFLLVVVRSVHRGVSCRIGG